MFSTKSPADLIGWSFILVVYSFVLGGATIWASFSLFWHIDLSLPAVAGLEVLGFLAAFAPLFLVAGLGRLWASIRA